MGDISRNLSRYEFECPCGCETDTVDYELVEVLQRTVNDFQVMYPDYDVAIHINSGCRCPDYNATIDGASPNSKHTIYRAADFYLYDKKSQAHIDDDKVYEYLDKIYATRFGIGRYNGRTHLDTRSTKARWDSR